MGTTGDTAPASGTGPARRVVVTDSGDLLRPGIERLEAAGVSVDLIEPGREPAEVAERISSAPVAIVGVLPLRRPEIAGLRDTGLLIRAGIGYDIIDVEAASAAGIWVANVPDYCVDEVADHTVLLLVAAARRLTETLETLRTAERWIVTDLLPPVHRIRDRRLGIVGLGRIGRAVAARARGFGWQVVGHDPLVPLDIQRQAGIEPVELDELFSTSDAITLHCPLTPETANLVDAARLAKVRPGLILVNTSRGGLVDLEALDAAIADGRVAAVGLDVLDGEPTPDLGHRLLARPQVIVTPHVAWYSIEARRELAVLAADEALRYLSGERPRNLVNPEARVTPG